jgi:predicted NBD/HSP70 family sugar kinase
MILNGQLYSGSRGFAGEFSHIRLEDEGELCICGKRGCIETMASAHKLLNLAISGVKNGTVSQLTRIFKNNPDEMQTEDVINAARGGDEFAISILNQVGSALGKGLSILIQLLNPELIVLSGPISQANQYIMTPIQQSLNQYCLENICSNVRLEISEIDEHSGLLGIAAMLFQKVFGDAMDELK